MDRVDVERLSTLRQADVTKNARRSRTDANALVVDRRARIVRQVGQTGVLRREEFADVRRTHSASVVTADLQAINRRPATTRLIGCGVELRARRRINAVAGIANASFQGQILNERLVLNQRRNNFANGFIDVVTAINVGRSTASAGQITALGERVRSLLGCVLAIFAANSERNCIASHRNGQANITRDQGLCLSQSGLGLNRAALLQELDGSRAQVCTAGEEVGGNAAIARVDTRGLAGGTHSLTDARVQQIALNGLDLLCLAIATRHIIVDAVGDGAAETSHVIEHSVLILRDTRTSFDCTTRQRNGQFLIVRVRRAKRNSRGIALSLGQQLTASCGSIRILIGAQRVADRLGQERVRHRHLNSDTKRARRRDDRVDLVLREQGTRIEFDAIRNLITALGVHVVTLERRLEDVQRVVVIRLRVRPKDVTARGRRDLARTENRQDQTCREGCARTGVGTEERVNRVFTDLAVALIDRISFLIAKAENHVAAAIVKAGTGGEVSTQGVAVTLFSDLLRERSFKAREVTLGDKVHNTRDSVGTISGRRTTGQHVNALNQGQRNVVQVETASQVSRNNATTVQKDDVAVRAQTTQVDERVTAVAVVNGRTNARNDARDFAENFFSNVVLLQFNRVSRGHVDGRRTLQVRIGDERTSDDDFVLGGVFISRLLLRERRRSDEREAEHDWRNASLQACKFGVSLHVPVPFLECGKAGAPHFVSFAKPGILRFADTLHPLDPGRLERAHARLRCAKQS